MAEITRSQLARRWIHSREEDAGAARVFRAEGFEFPRARGREAFTLRADGTGTDEPIGPGDAHAPHPIRWELDGERLIFRGAEGDTVRRILALAGDRLELEEP